MKQEFLLSGDSQESPKHVAAGTVQWYQCAAAILVQCRRCCRASPRQGAFLPNPFLPANTPAQNTTKCLPAATFDSLQWYFCHSVYRHNFIHCSCVRFPARVKILLSSQQPRWLWGQWVSGYSSWRHKLLVRKTEHYLYKVLWTRMGGVLPPHRIRLYYRVRFIKHSGSYALFSFSAWILSASCCHGKHAVTLNRRQK